VSRVFVDTAHHIAVFNVGDPLHRAAIAVANDMSADRSITFVTTHLVFAEFLASTSRASHLRVAAAEYVIAFIAERRVTVIDLARPLFERGLDLYQRRSDKSYSLTDCVSMVVCRDLGITDVLTADHDFEQEGCNMLLERAR
jgi:predicted nucleic acid-binding protein